MNMVSEEKELKVRELLKQKLSTRQIALRAGVSRSTVYNIAKSKGMRKRRVRYRNARQTWIPKGKRCPKCGGLVTRWPCLLCNPYIGENTAKEEFFRNKRHQWTNRDALMQIIDDLIALDSLGIIAHTLFTRLADRARESVGMTMKDNTNDAGSTH